MNRSKTLLALAISAAIAATAGCSSDSGTTAATTPTVTGTGAAAELTLSNDNIYTLAAGFPGTYIGNGETAGVTSDSVDKVTINVEPGTLVLGSAQEALIATRGSKININGTAADPVVMGSRKWFNSWVAKTAYTDTDYDGVNDIGENGLGEWAGLALMGFAQSNEGVDVIAEGGIGNYAGVDDADSSGSISYVVIRGAGNDLDGNGNELNGFTLFGVGSGTAIDHVQSHRGLDDGIEHFGSTDHISYFVATDNRDDSFDWGQGYRGSVQFALLKQSSDGGSGAGSVSDRMIEADNDKANPEATPVSLPTLANFSMISGTGVLNKDGKASEGVLMRRGTGFKLYNSVITQERAKECIEIDGDATFTEVAQGGTGSITGQTANGLAVNVVLNCQTKDGSDDTDSDGTIFNDADIITWFDSSANNVRGGSDFGFDADAVTTVPAEGTVDMQDTNFSLTVAMGGTLAPNFVETDYIGAFPQDSSNNWTDGWTINVNGNVTVWQPAAGGTLAGATPTGDGSCPTGTTFIETVDLPNGAGQMDVCQLQRRYDAGDF
ncbi:MAG: hypothetical protein IMF14_03580 [Proteobacteria bacterium]|nr:hypothetical protein [Pseudomonadota bacterium]